MKTIELLNIEEQLRLIGGEINEGLIDKYEINEGLIDKYETSKVESVRLSFNIAELSKLTK